MDGVTETATAWWTEAQFAEVCQELVRPTFRRSALMRAQRRHRQQKLDLPFHDWVQQGGVRRCDGNLTQEIVHELLDYCPETGVLTWRRRGRHWFETDRDRDAWNTRFAGKPAFSAVTNGRYLMGSIFGEQYCAHRIIWLWMTGHQANPEIDHEDHGGTNNRWNNLFEKTHIKNSRNQKMRNTNTSGRVGVWQSAYGIYVAEIMVRGEKINLGHYRHFEDACAAREAAERKYGFHENPGKVRP
jgi:hypothetical protein